VPSDDKARREATHAVLFPGQGSHAAGMRETVGRFRPELLEAAEDALGADLFDRVEHSTAAAQPAVFCASLAGWHALRCPRGAYMTGHSLGELAALVAAGSLAEAAGLDLAALRGSLMQEAVDANPGCGMLAVRAGAVDVGPIAARCGATIANYNAPRQVIVSGRAEALDRVTAGLGGLGIRSKRLPVAGAFHSPYMRPAVERYVAALAATDFRPPTCTVLSSTTARPFENVRSDLARSLTAPVRWRETVLALADAGVTTFHDVGPGRVLAGLVRRCVDGAHVETADELEAAHA
jgi:[acyl-carrier-protein] S-malonyltransferase